MQLRRRLFPTVISFAVALCLLGGTSVVAAGPRQAAQSGFRVLTGRAAAAFRLPADLRLVRTWRDERNGLMYERYQQHAQTFGALVEGAQLTVVRRAGSVALVIGAHYPSVAVSNRLLLDGPRAIGRALLNRTLLGNLAEPVRAALTSRTELRVDPTTGRLYYRVESGAPGVHVIQNIDAETGAVLDGWDAIDRANPGMGTGVRGDRKSLLGEGPGDPADDLTKLLSGTWRMQSVDGRMSTLDAKRGDYYGSGLSVMSDNAKPGWANDNDWAAAYQRAAVDAQYYGRLTDGYYLDPANVGGFDLIADCVSAGYGPIRNVVHYDEYPFDGFGFDNAFWDGFSGHLVYGDGDGLTTGGFAGSQDIVSHEMTHAVTQCRAPLDYSRQSGALNEAISDIMATAMEWEFNEPTSANCRREQGQAGCPDWWVGEDIVLNSSTFGFRNLADPESADQPGHWDDRFTGSYDDYGVHINSTIPTHAFYLMVNGGRNARCSGPTDPQADCDVVVPTIPIADAAQILFAAWGTLPNPSPSSAAGARMFCNAHDAGVAAADLLFPGSDLHRAAAGLAWAAVGRGEGDCHPTVGSADFAISMAQRSIALAPESSGQIAVTLTRGQGVSGNIDFTVSGGGTAVTTLTPPSSPTAQPNDGTILEIDVPVDMADGVYPLVLSASDGSRTRYASAVLVVDGTAPLVSVSQVHLDTNGQISASGVVPLRVTWSAADAASGLADADLEASGNGGAWSTVASGNGGTATVIAGANTYSFQVVAIDGVGNSATSDLSGPWGIGRFQEGAATYSGAWSALPGTQNWGSVRYSSKKGAFTSFTFNGTDVAWISSRGPNRGKAKILLDGVLLAKVDLYATASAALPRRIGFTVTGLAAGPHTLKVVVSGTSGRPRVDIDGFVVLTQPSP